MSTAVVQTTGDQTTCHVAEHYQAAFSFWSPHLAGADVEWVQSKRRHGIDRFHLTGFGSKDGEKWQHVPIDSITEHSYRLPDAPGIDPTLTEFQGALTNLYLPDLDVHRLVFVNGRYAPRLSQQMELPKGAVAGSLAEYLATPTDTPMGQEMKYHLDRYVNIPYSGFAVLNTALFADGALIYLPSGTVIERPVHLLFVSTFATDPIMTLPRILVLAGENSAVDVVESFGSLGNPQGAPLFTNAVTEVALGHGARVNHCKIQTESADASTHIALLGAWLEQDSRFASHSICAGARIARNDTECTLRGNGAECVLDGLYTGNHRQYADYFTLVNHEGLHTNSSQHYKGILAGRSHGVFNGKVNVHPDAQQTCARQRNENLLLSRKARIDTKPQLNILADDVQCTHGATVGQMDDNMLFYLRSRGIDAVEAERLLTYGFAGEIAERAPVPAVRTKLSEGLLSHILTDIART